MRREQRKAQMEKKNKPMMYFNGQKMGKGVTSVASNSMHRSSWNEVKFEWTFSYPFEVISGPKLDLK